MSRLDLIHDWLEMAERAHYSPSKLARQCGVSIRHLRRYFNCRCRQTPRAWLREVRLWKSIQLLLLQRSTIKEVAFALHFTRATTFHHLFTEEFQTPPLRLLANPRASNTLIARIKQARGHAAPGPRQSLRQLQDSVLALAMRRRL